MPTKGAAVHVVPLLSPVLEDFVPPQFRGNVPDTPRAGEQVSAPAPATGQELKATKKKEAAPLAAPEAPTSTGSDEDSSGGETTAAGMRSRLALTLLHWRKRTQRGLVQVSPNKPVQVQGLPRQKSSRKTRPSRRSTLQYLNPLCLLARLRDTYIHMMNTVATSGVVAGGPMGDDSGTQGSTLFFSREFDSESIAQLVELERSNSTRYDPSKPPVLSRSKTSRSALDVSASYFSFSNGASKSGRRLSGERSVRSQSKSNSLSDDVFFSQKFRSHSGKKSHVNPYADSNWSADRALAAKRETMSSPLDFHFQRQMRTSSGTEIRTREASLFAYR